MLIDFISAQLKLVSAFGDYYFVLISIILFSIIYLLYKGYKSAAVCTFLTFFSYPLSTFLKGVFQTTRPAGAVLNSLHDLDVYSFPSSHTFVYTTFWGFMLYLTFVLPKLDKLSIYIIRILGFYFILLVGISRVYMGQHYIVDVVGGYLFGGLLLLLIIMLFTYRSIFLTLIRKLYSKKVSTK